MSKITIQRLVTLLLAVAASALVWHFSRPTTSTAGTANTPSQTTRTPAGKPARLVQPDAIPVVPSVQLWAGKQTGSDAAELATTLLAQLRGSEEDVMTAMLNAVQLDTLNRIAFAAQALHQSDPGYRVDALGLLARIPSRKFSPLVVLGMNDSDPEVRKSALALLEAFTPEWESERQQALANLVAGGELDPELLQGLTEDDRLLINQTFTNALRDADAEVRAQAMQSLLQLDYDTQQQVFSSALLSEHEDVRLELVHILSTASTKDNIDLTFSALDDSSPAVRDAAINTLRGAFSQDFSSTAEAQQWWLRNQKNYDQELIPQNDSF